MPQKGWIASAVFLGLILAVTVIATGSRPKPVLIGAFAQYIAPAVLTIYLLVVLYNARAIIELLASFLLGNRKQDGSGKSWMTIVGYAIGLFLVFLFFLSLTRLQSVLRAVQTAVAGTWAAFGITQTLPAQSVTTPPNSYLVYYVVLLFIAIVLVSFTLFLGGIGTAYRWAREEHSPFETKLVRQETLRVVEGAVRDLKLAGDYRETILKCYVQMCNVLSLHGFRIGLQETAREFSSGVSDKLGLGGDFVRGLTFLFEEARYSNHQIDDTKRASALSQLESLERSLGSVGGGGL